MKAFEKMRLMQIKVILSTDLLSRGIDLPDVNYVVNFDMPYSEAEFMHRVGRCGRFGRLGMALSLVTDLDLNDTHRNGLMNGISYISRMIESS